MFDGSLDENGNARSCSDAPASTGSAGTATRETGGGSCVIGVPSAVKVRTL
jgi:hypothetical protein